MPIQLSFSLSLLTTYRTIEWLRLKRVKLLQGIVVTLTFRPGGQLANMSLAVKNVQLDDLAHRHSKSFNLYKNSVKLGNTYRKTGFLGPSTHHAQLVGNWLETRDITSFPLVSYE